jgi:PhnB protein
VQVQDKNGRVGWTSEHLSFGHMDACGGGIRKAGDHQIRRETGPTLYFRGAWKMKSIIPNLFIDDCRENLEYYRGIFGGELKNIIPRRDAPERIMHAELHINENCVLFFGDRLQAARPDPNTHIFLKLETEEEIRNAYNALKKDGTVVIELQDSFWGTLHAVLTDKNGITWDLDK